MLLLLGLQSVFNNLMFQWITITKDDGSYTLVKYPITMNVLFNCFVCPHWSAGAQTFWSDFGYSVTTSQLEIRCTHKHNILIIGI